MWECTEGSCSHEREWIDWHKNRNERLEFKVLYKEKTRTLGTNSTRNKSAPYSKGKNGIRYQLTLVQMTMIVGIVGPSNLPT